MSTNIPFENFEDIHQKIPMAFSFYKQKLITFAFIPKHLDIPDRPELNDFPRNILFTNTVQLGKYSDVRLALYEPDFSTFELMEGKKQLFYRNAHGGDSQVRIIKEDQGTYWGVKIVNGVEKSNSAGETWKDFFLYLSLPGIWKDEAFVNMLGGEILEVFPSKPQTD